MRQQSACRHPKAAVRSEDFWEALHAHCQLAAPVYAASPPPPRIGRTPDWERRHLAAGKGAAGNNSPQQQERVKPGNRDGAVAEAREPGHSEEMTIKASGQMVGGCWLPGPASAVVLVIGYSN